MLAVADEVTETLYGPRLGELRPDVIVSCGDLPFDFLEYLVTMTNVPLLYVLGNHDPDISRRPADDAWAPGAPFGWMERDRAQGPPGCTNVDGRVVEAAGLRIAGLGGSIRYSEGPNQYTQAQMRRRAHALDRRRGLVRRPPVDIVVSHAPPQGAGDGDDPAHRGVEALNWLIERWSPRLLIHGHLHPYGAPARDRRLGDTTVVNAVAHRLLEVEP